MWLCQSNKDLFCVSDQSPQFRPSTVQLPPETEMVHYSACQDAIWGLDSLGQIFIRTLSSSCPTGMHWTKLDLSQLGMTFLLNRLSINSLKTVFYFRYVFVLLIWNITCTGLNSTLPWSTALQHRTIKHDNQPMTAFKQWSLLAGCFLCFVLLTVCQFVRPFSLTRCCADIPAALTISCTISSVTIITWP